MSCCKEYGCRRATPIALYRADFSGTVYAVTKSHPVSDKTMAADQRHIVTDQMREFIRRNPEWVRAVLAEAETTRVSPYSDREPQGN